MKRVCLLSLLALLLFTSIDTLAQEQNTTVISRTRRVEKAPSKWSYLVSMTTGFNSYWPYITINATPRTNLKRCELESASGEWKKSGDNFLCNFKFDALYNAAKWIYIGGGAEIGFGDPTLATNIHLSGRFDMWSKEHSYPLPYISAAIGLSYLSGSKETHSYELKYNRYSSSLSQNSIYGRPVDEVNTYFSSVDLYWEIGIGVNMKMFVDGGKSRTAVVLGYKIRPIPNYSSSLNLDPYIDKLISENRTQTITVKTEELDKTMAVMHCFEVGIRF